MIAAVDARTRTAWLLALMAAAMVGLGFASVPLYRLFCEATGLDGTTRRAAAAGQAVAGRTVEIRFDANHVPGLPWSFKPEQQNATVTIGARSMAFFIATNHGTKPITGQAAFNVTPSQAGQYFNKIQCFCFTEQTLQPGQTVRMPVIYFVDPKMLADKDAKDVEAITLSYTFYPVQSSGETPVDAGKKPS